MTEASNEQDRIEQRNKEMRELYLRGESVTGWKYRVAPRREGIRYRCPCCYYKTLQERGGWEICPVCFWEDDGQDDNEADQASGPNHEISLTQARQNYREIGACEADALQFVRSPVFEEV